MSYLVVAELVVFASSYRGTCLRGYEGGESRWKKVKNWNIF